MRKLLLSVILLSSMGCTPIVVPVFFHRPNINAGVNATQDINPEQIEKAVRAAVAAEMTERKLLSLPRTIKDRINWKFWFYAGLIAALVLTLTGVISVKWWMKMFKAGKEYAEDRWTQTKKAIEEYKDEEGEIHPKLEKLLDQHQDEDTRSDVKRSRKTGVI